MTVTHIYPDRDRYGDHAAGLIYFDRLGPAVPALTAAGLGYVRDDLLARAAGAEAQGATAQDKGDWTLAAVCAGQARTCREAAKQIVTYSLNGWGVTE